MSHRTSIFARFFISKLPSSLLFSLCVQRFIFTLVGHNAFVTDRNYDKIHARAPCRIFQGGWLKGPYARSFFPLSLSFPAFSHAGRGQALSSLKSTLERGRKREEKMCVRARSAKLIRRAVFSSRSIVKFDAYMIVGFSLLNLFLGLKRVCCNRHHVYNVFFHAFFFYGDTRIQSFSWTRDHQGARRRIGLHFCSLKYPAPCWVLKIKNKTRSNKK